MKNIKSMLADCEQEMNAEILYKAAFTNGAKEIALALSLDEKSAVSEMDKAISWYRKIKNNRHRWLFNDQVAAACDNWLFMKRLCAMNLSKEAHTASKLKTLADAVLTVLPEAKCDDYMDTLYEALSIFLSDTETVRVKKESKSIIKCSLVDTYFNDKHELMINSDNADAIITKKRIVVDWSKSHSIKAMRIVSTSESGLSRELDAEIEQAKANGIDVTRGLPVAIFVDVKAEDILTPEERKDEELVAKAQKEIDDRYDALLNNGFTDVATGVHYMHAQKGASMTRKDTHFCLSFKDWYEVVDFYCKILGGTAEQASKAFGDKVVLAKVPAYLALCMSSTVNPAKSTRADMVDRIREYNNRVLFVKDVDIYVDRPYTKMVKWYDEIVDEASGTIIKKLRYKMEDVLTDPQVKTASDGMGTKSVEYTIEEGYWQQDLNGIEYIHAKTYWENHKKHGGSLATAAQWFIKLIAKCAVRQIRIMDTGIKGMIVTVDKTGMVATKTYREVCYIIPDGVNPDDPVDLSKFDLFIPKSMIKFMVKDKFDISKLNICATNKRRRDRYVNMNSQFISALFWDDPDELDVTKIVRDHLNTINKVMAGDEVETMKFHKIFGSADSDRTSILKEVLSTAPFLKDEPYIMQLRSRQIDSALKQLSQCLIPVPGVYGYEVFDPYNFMNITFGCNALELPSKYSYFNGEANQACLFRSPLLAHQCVVKTELMSSREYRHYGIYVDCIVFNGYDGLWDSMSGSDFDGDTAGIVTNNTLHGEIIVNGYRGNDMYEVGGYAMSGPKVSIDLTDVEGFKNQMIKFFKDNHGVDRTGKITQRGARAQELANHLRMLVKFSKKLGYEKIRFVDPASYGYGCGCNVWPKKDAKLGMIVARGFADYLGYDADTKKNLFDYDVPWALVGDKDIETVKKAIWWLEYIAVNGNFSDQSQEIDGAKTGCKPHLHDDLNVKACARNTIAYRRYMYGKINKEEWLKPANVAQSYMSWSFWGLITQMIDREIYDIYYAKNGDRVHNVEGTDMMGNEVYTCNTIYDKFMAKATSSNKLDILMSLLDDSEREELYKERVYNHQTFTLISNFKDIRKEYGLDVKAVLELQEKEDPDAVSQTREDQEESFGNVSVNDIKDKYRERILKAAQRYGLSPEIFAAACYIATYTDKNGMYRCPRGTSFAWILWDYLLNIFVRKDDIWQLHECGDGVVSVRNGVMYCNDERYTTIDAYDIEDARTIIAKNGKRMAYVHMHMSAIRKANNFSSITDRKSFMVNIFGNKVSVNDMLEIIKAYKGFDIHFEDESEGHQLCAYVNDAKIGVLNIASNMVAASTLDGTTVKVVSYESVKITKKSLVGLEVVIVSGNDPDPKDDDEDDQTATTESGSSEPSAIETSANTSGAEAQTPSAIATEEPDIDYSQYTEYEEFDYYANLSPEDLEALRNYDCY